MNYLIKKFILFIFLFDLLFIFSFPFYNQKGVKAQETVICDKEIPIGESMDKTYEFLMELIEEHQKVYEAIYDQTQQAESMVNLAKECDTYSEAEDICIWPCCKYAIVDVSSILGVPIYLTSCPSKTCVSKLYGSTFFEALLDALGLPLSYGGCKIVRSAGRANGPGDVCPTAEIQTAWDKQKEYAYSEREIENEEGETETIIDGVIGSSGNIIALILGDVGETIPPLNLTIKTTILVNGREIPIGPEYLDNDEDRGEETIVKKLEVDEDIRLEGEAEDEEILWTDYIERKLAVARQKFSDCALTPHEIEALMSGELKKWLLAIMYYTREKWPRWVWPTDTVIDEKIYLLPERLAAEKEKGGCKEICGENYDAQKCFECMYKSLLNYYCCH